RARRRGRRRRAVAGCRPRAEAASRGRAGRGRADRVAMTRRLLLRRALPIRRSAVSRGPPFLLPEPPRPRNAIAPNRVRAPPERITMPRFERPPMTEKTEAIPRYDFRTVERKWQERWEASGAHRVDVARPGKKFYCLVMFSYPSGDRLHVGHW